MIYDLEKLEKFFLEENGFVKYDGSRNNLITKCPVCEKDNHKKSGHLYISLHDPIYNCYKCVEEVKNYGFVSKLFKLYEVDFKEFLTVDSMYIQNWKTYSYFKKINSNFEINNLKYSKVESEKYVNKLSYLHSRFGMDVDISKIPNLVFNIREFIFTNNIILNDFDNNFLDFYDKNFIGFVTNRGTQMILRNVDSSSEYRYKKIQLREGGFFKDFYGFQISPIRKNLNTIVLCEGVFDLLTPIFSSKLLDLRNNSTIWAAILGNKYQPSIPSILDYYKLLKVDVVVLSDNNLLDTDYTWLQRSPFVRDLKIYWNKSGKDFGDLPIDPIMINFDLRNTKGFIEYAKERRKAFN